MPSRTKDPTSRIEPSWAVALVTQLQLSKEQSRWQNTNTRIPGSTAHDIKEKATGQFERMADKATDQFKSAADQAEHVANRVAEQGEAAERVGGRRQPEGRRRSVRQDHPWRRLPWSRSPDSSWRSGSPDVQETFLSLSLKGTVHVSWSINDAKAAAGSLVGKYLVGVGGGALSLPRRRRRHYLDAGRSVRGDLRLADGCRWLHRSVSRRGCRHRQGAEVEVADSQVAGRHRLLATTQRRRRRCKPRWLCSACYLRRRQGRLRSQAERKRCCATFHWWCCSR